MNERTVSRGRVLVVEDEAYVRDSLVEILRARHFDVGAAGSVAEVADRGPGIAEGERQRIFEPFFSTKNSTGLGLSICHAIVREHGGEVTALPREAGGTVFRVELPRRAEGA